MTMIVGNTHKKILKALNEQPRTMDELVKSTGYSRDGLRGRISEMRKMGYQIDLVLPTEKEYVVVSKPKDKVLDYLKKSGNYGRTINIRGMSTILKLPREIVKSVIAELFSSHKVTQLSNDTFIIKELD